MGWTLNGYAAQYTPTPFLRGYRNGEPCRNSKCAAYQPHTAELNPSLFGPCGDPLRSCSSWRRGASGTGPRRRRYAGISIAITRSPRQSTWSPDWWPTVACRARPRGIPIFPSACPAAEIDARRFTWLTVRLYSSEKADLLDIYYQSPDERWCLGGKFPILKGWATYCLDLTQNHWRETATGDVSKQWGGPSKRVSSLRIDPGNQADRWVAVDYVRLQTAAPGLQRRSDGRAAGNGPPDQV